MPYTYPTPKNSFCMNLNVGPHRDMSPHESVYSGLSPHQDI